MSVNHLNGHHETFKEQFIKWTISGDLSLRIGLISHQNSLFWSTRQLFLAGYYGRPCSYVVYKHTIIVDEKKGLFIDVFENSNESNTSPLHIQNIIFVASCPSQISVKIS